MIIIASSLDLRSLTDLFEKCIAYNTVNIDLIKSCKKDYVIVNIMTVGELSRLKKHFSTILHIESYGSNLIDVETIISPSKEIEDIKSTIYLELLILNKECLLV